MPDGLDDKCGGCSWSFTLSTSLGGEEVSLEVTWPFGEDKEDTGFFLEPRQRLVTGLSTSLGGEEVSLEVTWPFGEDKEDTGFFLEPRQRLVTGPWILTVPSDSRGISLLQIEQFPLLDESGMDEIAALLAIEVESGESYA